MLAAALREVPARRRRSRRSSWWAPRSPWRRARGLRGVPRAARRRGALPELAESDALGMCYTSGTTGKPKGVVYTHRSTLLHALVTALPDSLSSRARTRSLPVVPMFHVNAWGLPYACGDGRREAGASRARTWIRRACWTSWSRRRSRSRRACRRSGSASARRSTRSRQVQAARRACAWSSAARRRRSSSFATSIARASRSFTRGA